MPAPAMPVAMRGDGRGSKLKPKKAPTRYFAGQGEEIPEDEDEEDASEAELAMEGQEKDEAELPATTQAGLSVPSINLKDINLRQHYEQERSLEAQRLELEAAAAQEDESEYETDAEALASDSEQDDSDSEEEEEAAPRRALPKPNFIPKSQRQSQPQISKTMNGEAKEDATSVLDEQQRRRLEARDLIQHQKRQEALPSTAGSGTHAAEAELDDTDRPEDAAAALQAWKVRELQRIKRDRDALEAKEREREALDARMQVPEATRIAEAQRERDAKIEAKRAERAERANGVGPADGTNSHESYHHRGAFYQDDPLVKRRLEGTLENTGAGQGLRGAIKKTNLVNQDTSRDSMWHQQQRDNKRHFDNDRELDEYERKRRG